MRAFLLAGALLLVVALLIWWLWGRRTYTLPWDLWAEIRASAEASPDHLETRAREHVAARDAAALFAFVRDAVRTLGERSIGTGELALRSGRRGVLRSGAGTELEKCLLLIDLLREAGHEAELVRLPGGFPAGLIARTAEVEGPAFAPARTAGAIEARLPLGSMSSGPRAVVLPAPPAGTDAVSAGLVPLLEREPRPRTVRAGRQAHAVRLRDGSSERILAPGLAGSPFGLEVDPRLVRPADEAELRAERPRLTVRLLAAYDDSSYTPFTVAEGAWPVDDVASRDIRLGYKLIGPPELLLQARVRDFESFVPSIDVLAPAVEDRPEFHVTGDMLTTGGRVVPIEQPGQLGLSDLALASADPAQAATLTLDRVLLADYPIVRIEATVADAGGAPLMGLEEDDFTLEINGEPVTHRVVVNQSIPPRVLFLYDDSTSMPGPYQSRERTAELLARAFAAAQEANPDTLVRIAAFGDAYSKVVHPSAWSRDIGYLRAHLLAHRSGRSNNWSALVGGVSSDANLVILLTDADGTEKPSDYDQRRIAEGVSALILGVESNRTQSDQFEAMAAWSRGAHFLVERDMDAALAELRRRVGETKNTRYLLEAVVAGDEVPELDLRLGVGAGSGPLEARLAVPTPGPGARSPLGKNAITGLYVEVDYAGRVHRTTLAGVPYGATERSHPITAEMIAACNNALLGEYVLHVEAGTPARAAVVADHATHLLELARVEALLRERDPQAFFRALQDLHWQPEFPGKWALATAAGATVSDGVRVWMHAVQPDASGRFQESLTRLGLDAPARADETSASMAALVAEQLVPVWAARRALEVADSGPLAGSRVVTQGRDGRIAIARVQRTSEDDAAEAALMRNRVVDTPARVFLPESGAFAGAFRLVPVDGSLDWVDRHGNTATRALDLRLDRDARLIDTPFAWRRTLGMRMETWSDLEANKLAYIQVGTVAVKGLGASRSPEEIMQAVQALLLPWAREPAAHGPVTFLPHPAAEASAGLIDLALRGLDHFHPPKP